MRLEKARETKILVIFYRDIVTDRAQPHPIEEMEHRKVD